MTRFLPMRYRVGFAVAALLTTSGLAFSGTWMARAAWLATGVLVVLHLLNQRAIEDNTARQNGTRELVKSTLQVVSDTAGSVGRLRTAQQAAGRASTPEPAAGRSGTASIEPTAQQAAVEASAPAPAASVLSTALSDTVTPARHETSLVGRVDARRPGDVGWRDKPLEPRDVHPIVYLAAPHYVPRYPLVQVPLSPGLWRTAIAEAQPRLLVVHRSALREGPWAGAESSHGLHLFMEIEQLASEVRRYGGRVLVVDDNAGSDSLTGALKKIADATYVEGETPTSAGAKLPDLLRRMLSPETEEKGMPQ